MTKTRFSKRILSLLLCVALCMSYIPLTAAAAVLAQSAVVGAEVDPGTADSWETMMGTDMDGNRYAGRVWVDKSVYKNGDTAILNSRGEAGSSFQVSLKDGEAFQVIFSALGSTMASKESTTSTGPMDVVLVLDTSTSMDDEDRQGVTRLQRTIEAANTLLSDLLTINNVRIAIVTYNKDSETVLPLSAYNNGVRLVVTDYYNNGSSDAGVVTAYDNNNRELGKDSGYTMGTNLQSGIDRGFNILANATNVDGRAPVAIVLTDGQANRASQEGFYELSTHDDQDGTSASNRNLYLSTLLNAAYTKTKIEANYGKDATVYTVGVDVSNNTVARLLMNPANATSGFNASNSDTEIRRAYENFQKWAKGENVTYSNWTFDHGYPTLNGAITDAKIAANINYADNYFDVSNADLAATFEQIYEELSSGAFNPISSSTSVSGGIGVDDTPLIYVDFIGQYMEIKEIQAITLFGNSYGVVKNSNGTYTVTEATGTNPTTNESWNTAEDIMITVNEQTDGTQKLEIRINQEILPIIMERVVSETVGGVTTSTITEFMQAPMRVYYTVGVASDVLLPNGSVDVSKIQGYSYVDDVNGTVSFYSNQFGIQNPADSSGVVTKGDAHVGFQPSAKNRYYYHQANQRIFSAVERKDGAAIEWEDGLYGTVWQEGVYNLTDIDYATYLQYNADYDRTENPVDHQIYTYVNFYRPTTAQNDAADAAELATYLVYTNWSDLRESVAFYDATTGKYVNYSNGNYKQDSVGYTMTAEQIAAYVAANPTAEIYAVLGVGSLRTSRFHNMIRAKTENTTDTATQRYTPEYTYETAANHNNNDVVVWLGNSGRLTVKIDTGIALTKSVTESIGNVNDSYKLTVTVPAGVAADPAVVDAEGNPVESTYSGNVLTVQVKAGQTVYVSGIPGGTECEIGEIVEGDYYIAAKTDKVTVPKVSEALNGAAQFVSANVTNAPNKYGNLYITKEITSDHTVPNSVMDTAFEITVNLGAALAGKVFAVEDSAHTTPYNVTADASGKITFQIKARQTVEILGIPAGTAVTVTEATPDSHFAVSYRTRNHSGEAADTDNVLAIPADGSATAVVFNRYTPNSVSVDLDIAGTKNFIVEGAHSGGKFTYQVQKWNGTAWEDISGKTAETPYAADESGTKHFTIEDVLAGITYTEVGSYAYQVLEVKGDVANVTYDRTLYTFTVTVTDNGGQLVAAITDLNNTAITDGSYEVTFNNTYNTAPVSVDVQKLVENKSGDGTVSKAGFEFKAVRTDSSWIPLTGNDAAAFSIYSDGAGEARFTSVCTVAGTYYFVLSEVNQNAPGWSYSQAEYRITVEVIPNNGNLTASLTIVKANSANEKETVTIDQSDASKGTVIFENTYDPQDVTVDLDGTVIKELTGKTLEKDAFTFYVCEDGTAASVRAGTKQPVLVGKNNHAGDVRIVDFDGTLLFEEAGVYAYDMIEAIPAGAVLDAATGKYVLNGMHYDPTIYDLVVEVTNDSTTGALVASYYFEDSVTDTVTFRNVYIPAPAQYTLGGSKVLRGRAPKAGEFSFELYAGATLLERVTNDADGRFTFKPITYTAAGSYTYTIKEASGNVAGVRYDGVNKPVTVTVNVTDTNGVLHAAGNVANTDIVFENTYIPNSAQVTFNGTKVLKGDTLEDYAFTFKLYKTDNSFDITKSSAELLAAAKNADGKFSFARTLNTTGTYYFVIVEDATVDTIADVVYDRTQHRFTVQVSDIGDGQLKAVITNMNTGVSTASAAAVSANIAFTNAAFEEVTEKEVYLAGNTATHIDGQKVQAGDILTYFITYTNYTGENVAVDIMDTIPENTSYVDGSASHNGTYIGTHINWIINVAKGESVTVSFDVKVEQDEAVVANTAVVRDGVNTYTTNEVVNHTVENVLEKEVFTPGDITANIDGEKVYAGDELLYKISFTNTTGNAANIKIADKIPANTTYVLGSADNGGVYADGAIVWDIKDVPGWATVTVSFKVAVNSEIGAETIKNQATATDGTNNYQTQWVTNYTVKDEVEKKVFDAGNPAVNIDGKAVEYGDTLVYQIRYKNTASEKVTVTVKDTISPYTTYMDGTADHGGVYADGVLTWVLEVDAGAEVTVSFKAKVTAATDAAVTNKAVVQEGKNTYTTNEVSTPISVPDIPPQTGENTMVHLWFALLFVSGGGILTVSLLGKKKKEAESR